MFHSSGHCPPIHLSMHCRISNEFRIAFDFGRALMYDQFFVRPAGRRGKTVER
jgi:hypothetical protein